jgi:phosphoribosyl 1,2-cyclic phosphodiesterase
MFFKAKIEFQDFKSGDVLRPHDDVILRTTLLDHPDGTNGYRLEYGGRIFALLCDTEGFPGKRDSEMVELARHADLALYDSTFTESEIVSKAGWGHSTWMRGVRLANEAEVKHLCLFHHDPSHDDDFMDKWQPKQPTSAPEQSLPEKVRLSIVIRSIDAVAIVCVPCWSSANSGR